MKTILAPTDFSPAATNAVRFAFMIAQELHARLKICHVMDEIPYAVVPGHDGYGGEADNENWKNTEKELAFLQNSLPLRGNDGSYAPEISTIVGAGTVAKGVMEIFRTSGGGVVVIGASGKNFWKRLFYGSATGSLIGLSTFPLILVPESFMTRPIKKIAFATDLHADDIALLGNLAEFARYFNAELLIAHVVDAPGQQAKQINLFLDEITDRLCYPKIYYRCIFNENTDDGLNWLSEHGEIDLLTMVHRKNSWLHPSHCRKISAHPKVPLMILPENLTQLFF
ncbi:universal stress protein [Mucilaginibacter conchicola]|uniref:Universal stress protein n=1 Tax=Mucilaginibacter conchicola TaxID=2303333 RepID=A0A372NLV7_9SPHI|nr:universal stress protein [Mucilaginibacter conchicola]RFZ89939.1 universal stress protein [Mucilaginibacter conchicola]